MSVKPESGIKLVPEVTCPNCWTKFPVEVALAVAGHAELVGDPRLEDEEEPRRFLPTRFSPECAAIDARGTHTLELACPACHLVVPRVLLERRATLFLSIFGRAQSGKSYFLSAMTRELERILPRRLGVGFTEPHPPSNRLLQRYRNSLFNHPDPDMLVDIPKTERAGKDWYRVVRYGDDDVRQYPRPMFFQCAPVGAHPHVADPAQYSRTICLYDNAGEHFEPEYDRPNSPETQHLSRSGGLLFVFDPTQEPAFLRECRGKSADPQFEQNVFGRPIEHVPASQDRILNAASENVKKRLGHESASPLDVPLVVIVAKFDAWRSLLKSALPNSCSGRDDGSERVHGFRISEVEAVSRKVRALLWDFCPAIVTAAERFSRRVAYIPVSATGCSPIRVGVSPENKPIYKFRAGAIKPEWVEVPMLWILSQVTNGIVPTAKSST